MPYVVKFLDSHHSKFKLKFCFSDEGEDGFISFDRAFNTDPPIIPDLYSLADARTLRFYPIHTQEEFAPVFSRKPNRRFLARQYNGLQHEEFERCTQQSAGPGLRIDPRSARRSRRL